MPPTMRWTGRNVWRSIRTAACMWPDERLLRAQAQRMLGSVGGARAAGGDEHPVVQLAHAELLR